ncbi:MAG TPA: hypothetical protein VGQ93_06315 [Lysobacter sp.]|nr:hypothetical protein [Lysobacter sp.]
MLRAIVCLCLSLASVTAFAAEPAPPEAKSEAKSEAKTPTADARKGVALAGDMVLSGLSILGNDETPKELVIVPWKSSQLADAPGISRLLDDSTQPVDKDVFMRELQYFELKSADADGQ